jgi:hypothetical protein
MFPPRAPFFSWARLSPRAQVGARSEDSDPGNLPVPHNPLSTATHHCVAAFPRYASITRSSFWISCGAPSAIFSP